MHLLPYSLFMSWTTRFLSLLMMAELSLLILDSSRLNFEFEFELRAVGRARRSRRRYGTPASLPAHVSSEVWAKTRRSGAFGGVTCPERFRRSFQQPCRAAKWRGLPRHMRQSTAGAIYRG